MNNIVVISDTHFGCRHALSPETFMLDGGTMHTASAKQLKLLQMWNYFWDKWVPGVTKGEPYIVVVNGDCIDGSHHRSVSQISHNLEDQRRMAIQMLSPIVEACDGKFFMLRGTEAHVGSSGQDEESVARALGAIPDADGNHARYELWIRLNDYLCQFMHHIGTTGRSHYETSAVMAELAEHYTEAGRNRQEPPDVIVRSHRHRAIEVKVPTAKGHGVAFVTPAWQLKTPFVYKIPGGRITTPQIGGCLIRADDDGIYTRSCIWHIERPKTVVAEVV